jgi:hypothetical protein
VSIYGGVVLWRGWCCHVYTGVLKFCLQRGTCKLCVPHLCLAEAGISRSTLVLASPGLWFPKIMVANTSGLSWSRRFSNRCFYKRLASLWSKSTIFQPLLLQAPGFFQPFSNMSFTTPNARRRHRALLMARRRVMLEDDGYSFPQTKVSIELHIYVGSNI